MEYKEVQKIAKDTIEYAKNIFELYFFLTRDEFTTFRTIEQITNKLSL